MNDLLFEFSNITDLKIEDDKYRRYYMGASKPVENIKNLEYSSHCLEFRPNLSSLYLNFPNLEYLKLNLKSFYWINMTNLKNDLPNLKKLEINIPPNVSPNKPQHLD